MSAMLEAIREKEKLCEASRKAIIDKIEFIISEVIVAETTLGEAARDNTLMHHAKLAKMLDLWPIK